METRTDAVHNCHRKDQEIRRSQILHTINMHWTERKGHICLYLMMAPWKWISIIFYNSLMIIAPLKKMWLSYDTNFSRIDSQRDVLIILLPNWRSWVRNVNFQITELTCQRYDRNWNHRQSFKATSTPRTWFDIGLCSKTWTCIRGN